MNSSIVPYSTDFPRLPPTMSASELDNAMLLLQLADPNQTLTEQNLHPLNGFTLFRKLPLEIRLYIFRLTFPSTRRMDLRDFRLDYEDGWNNCAGDPSKFNFGKPHRYSIPVALHVSQESRTETLKHYRVLYREKWVSKWKAPKKREDRKWMYSRRWSKKAKFLVRKTEILCFSPERDIMCCNSFMAVDSTDQWFDTDSMLEWTKGAKRLELAKGDSEFTREFWAENGWEICDDGRQDGPVPDYTQPDEDILMFSLRDLEEVTIIWCETWDSCEISRAARKDPQPRRSHKRHYEFCRIDARRLERYHNQIHSMDPTYKVPKVTMFHRVAPLLQKNEIQMYPRLTY
ncbi:hypothetical protein B0J14DRAFT_20040 [Halenospora varia]|nr:hypothetical protein B0J14DRAFT_20040 [Halenospora varia]